jgi:putative hydrolase
MVQEASEKGIEYLGITEHAPKMPGTCHDMYFLNLGVVERYQKGVHLLMGAELNIMDYKGRVDLPEYLIKRLDIVIASLHTPCIKSGTAEENTSAILHAIKNPLIHIIGHPDDGRYPVDYEAVVKAAKEYHTLLELNNTSLNPQGPRKGTWDNDRKMLELCRQYNVCVVLGSDAHCAERIGDFERVYQLLDETGFPEELIVNRDFAELEKFLRRRE